jgi:hypothetical protein
MVASASGRASAAIVTGEIYFIGGDPLNYLSPSVVSVGPGVEYVFEEFVARISIDIDPVDFSVAVDTALKGPSVFFPWDLRLTLDEPWPALTLTQDSFVPGMTSHFDSNGTFRVWWPGATILEPEVSYSARFTAPGSPSSVPEPGTIALLLAGICLMTCLRRRSAFP